MYLFYHFDSETFKYFWYSIFKMVHKLCKTTSPRMNFKKNRKLFCFMPLPIHNIVLVIFLSFLGQWFCWLNHRQYISPNSSFKNDMGHDIEHNQVESGMMDDTALVCFCSPILCLPIHSRWPRKTYCTKNNVHIIISRGLNLSPSSVDKDGCECLRDKKSAIKCLVLNVNIIICITPKKITCI